MGKKKAGKKKKAAKKEEAPAPAPAPQMQQPMQDEMSFVQPRVVFEKPASQLQLTEAELKVEHQRMLTWKDPNVANNIIKYSFVDRCYKLDPPGDFDQLAIHYSLDGCMLFEGSEEAVQQMQAAEAAAEALAEEKAKRDDAVKQLGIRSDDMGAGMGKVATEGEQTKNQFNFSERACQTYNNPVRDIGVSTVPPQREEFHSTVTKWSIYDAYMNEFEAQIRNKEMMKKSGKKKNTGPSSKKPPPPVEQDDDVMHSPAMGAALSALERMVNQNREDEIYLDYKYWEDLSDKYREGEGSLLPLWRFQADRTKHKHVTCLCWHPYFNDLFAVGFGSFNFMQQSSGLIYCYSLKNTSHPEFTFSTETGVLCLDFHPQHHSLLCVGCYDGSVMVFDVRKKENRPIYVSTVRTGKHMDPVWQVFWQKEDLSKELNFFSVASDGIVANWLMTNTELKMEVVMQLKLTAKGEDDQPEMGDETSLTGLAGGCCFDFNKRREHLFVVGTEEGRLHKCSKAYSGQYLQTFEGHHMVVYAVKWNHFHPRIFISCSADWTVKVWDHSTKEPLFTFDLGEAVGDVAWSPYSSTVFAAVTSDGKVHVFDLSVNKHEPLCEQKVVKRSKLTTIRFNKASPIVIVGDERGSIISLKLSPNLRQEWKQPESPTGDYGDDVYDAETKKMDALLASVDARLKDS